jgi:hypothetical protein
MIAAIFAVRANPKLKEKRIWKFNLTTFAYAMIVYFLFMALIDMNQRGFLF